MLAPSPAAALRLWMANVDMIGVRAGMDEDWSDMKPAEGAATEASPSEEPLYVISVAAKLVRMPTWTLRVLDEQGIVVPQRTDKKRRLYSDRDLAKLARVRTLTEDEGVNINGVRLILQIEDQRYKGD